MASDRRHRDRGQAGWLALGLGQDGLADDELDTALLELAADLIAQLLLVGPAENLRSGLEDRDLLVRPAVADLARELEAGRARPDDQHTSGTGELVVGLAVPGNRRRAVVGAGLRREGIGRAGRKHEHVGLEFVTGRKHDAAGLDGDGAVAHDPSVLEQVVVGQKDPAQPFGVDERPQRGDVVDERVARFNEDDVGELVDRLRGGRAAVAAAYHRDKRPLPGPAPAMPCPPS